MHISLIAAMVLAAAVPLPAKAEELNFPSGMNVFTLQEPVRFSAGKVPEITLIDNLGKSVSKKAGEETLFDFGRMPAGYYRILAGQKEIGNFTVTLPPEAYPNDRNTAIGLDYAMNTAHLPLPGPALRRELERNVQMARKAGVRRVRERFRANQEITRNADGSFTIDPKGRTMLTLGIDHAAGFAVCAVSQWTPTAVNRDRNQKKIPEKLSDTDALYHAIGKAWGPLLEGIELGNEIDLRAFYEGTAGEYAAYTKAASLALRRAAPGLLVVQSSFARPALHLKEALEEVYFPMLEELISRNGAVDYWALGHVHSFRILHESDPVVVYPGCPQGRSVHEPGKRGFALVTVDRTGRAKTEFREAAVLRFEVLNLDALDDCTTFDRMAAQLREGAERMMPAEGAGSERVLLRVILRGATPLNGELRKLGEEELFELFRGELARCGGNVFLESVELETRGMYDAAALTRSDDLAAEIAAAAAELRAEGSLRELLRKLRAGRYGIDDFSDAELDEIRSAAETRLLDELTGTGGVGT